MSGAARRQSRGSPWLKRLKAGPGARLRLYGIAHAGGGASTFRSWPAALPEQVELIGVQLPGREERLGEPAQQTIAPIVAALADELADEQASEPRAAFAFFGYSMGSLIAFELSRELRRRGCAAPSHLFAAAHRAPQLPMPVLDLADLPDDEFIAAVNRRYDAVPEAVAADAGLMELLLPTLRADMAVCDTYVYTDEAPLDLPISVFGGETDHNVSRSELDAWQAQTTGAFEATVLRGDHFFVTSSAESLLKEVSRTLQEIEA